MLQNNAVYGLLAIGEMMVIITAGIDISIGATLSLTGVICCRLMAENPGVPGIVWLVLSLVIGALCGAFNGLLVGYFKMVPIIATLGTMYIFRGFSFLFSGGEWWFPHQFTEGYMAFATKKILGIPSILWILIIVFVLAILFLGYTSKGRRIYAIGTNQESAQVAGIKQPRVVFLAMTLCGMLAGLSGMLYTANYATCSYMMGDAYEMTVDRDLYPRRSQHRRRKGKSRRRDHRIFDDVGHHLLYQSSSGIERMVGCNPGSDHHRSGCLE